MFDDEITKKAEFRQDNNRRLLLQLSDVEMVIQNIVELRQAQQKVEDGIRDFIKSPFDPYPVWWAAIGGSRISESALASVRALEVATGVGKTTTLIKQVVAHVRKLRDLGSDKKVLVVVPRHTLGDQTATDFRKEGVTAAVLRSRRAKTLDPEYPDVQICYDLQAVEDAERAGEPVQSSCCKNDRHICPFFNRCGYQLVLRQDPDVWIAAHEYLSHNPEVFGEVALVFIDESFWQAVTDKLKIWLGNVTTKGLTLGEIDGIVNSVMDVELNKRRFVGALRDHETPANLPQDRLISVEQKLLRAAGLNAEACDEVARMERRSAERVPLTPGMSAQERAEALGAVGRTKAQAARIARMWEAAADLLRQPEGSRSGRLFIEATDRVIHVQSGPKIYEGWRKFPTMMVDATLPPRDLLNHFFPRHQIIKQDPGITNVEMPLTRVRQVINAPVSAKKLGVEENQQALRRYVLRRRIETGRGKTLVIAQKKAAEWLEASELPENIVVRHFNDLTGMNDGNDVRLLIVAGRPLPSPRSVELITGAVTGVMPTAARMTGNKTNWYDESIAPIKAKDGRTCYVKVDRHPDPMAEIVRWLICEGELLQAIGRGRAVRRGENGLPLSIDLLADVFLPTPVDELVTWDEVKVGRELAMLEAGVVLTSPADMAVCWPEVWKNAKSAENWQNSQSLLGLVNDHIQGEGGAVKFGGIAIRYQHPGPRQRWRNAYYDPAIVPDPREWLESRLGALAGFELLISTEN